MRLPAESIRASRNARKRQPELLGLAFLKQFRKPLRGDVIARFCRHLADDDFCPVLLRERVLAEARDGQADSPFDRKLFQTIRDDREGATALARLLIAERLTRLNAA